MNVNIGGDRLGSGNKNDLHLHNYYRSTHNLSQDWTSPMTVGALYPFLVIPAMRNDKFEIKLNADCITIPTEAPLFGSFKMQTDVFFYPARLAQAILHNNPINIGLKMNQVMLPTFHLEKRYAASDIVPPAINKSALWKYLGLSGIGRGYADSERTLLAKRDINAVPLLAYYDIFKNYYANKQEDYAYVIGGGLVQTTYEVESSANGSDIEDDTEYNIGPSSILKTTWTSTDDTFKEFNINTFSQHWTIKFFSSASGHPLIVELTFLELLNAIRLGELRNVVANTEANEENKVNSLVLYFSTYPNYNGSGCNHFKIYTEDANITEKRTLKLNKFALKNIDDMRKAILSYHTLGASFKVDEQNYLPYSANNFNDSANYPLNGLVVKTYQSDLFNNWINTEWIDGENGIAEITKVSTSDGAFKIDALNLAEKLYNMLNRVAVSGGTYEDWQNAVYDEAPRKQIESPIYLGGMSSEIVFQQITSTASAVNANGENEPLGSMAGQGKHIKRKGGNIVCKCEEAGFIIGIVSITPRIKYHQGNEFYLTEIQSLDDLHKPALDGIGFQNLLGERLAWWDTKLDRSGNPDTRSIIGKVPAWIEYMTAVDKTYGDFAEEDGKAYMVLNRNYEMDTDGTIKDATTYIDPTKFNYAFTYKAIDAQNFWAEIYSHITARRKMSAKQIPNI